MLLSALLGEEPPRLPVRRLLRVAALFDINPNRARVALSRMAQRGEVTSDERGTYALSGRHLERAARLHEARSARTGAFDGTWHVVVARGKPEAAAARRERRRALAAARLGELREGVWLRPANLEVRLPAEVGDSVLHLVAVPETDPAALAAQVFDVAGWARRARVLLDDLADARDDVPLASGFELDAEVLRHLQRDPLLPAELLAADWPGAELRAGYGTFHERYREQLAAAHRAAAG